MSPYELPTWSRNGDLHVVVETPKGSQVKLAWDAELCAFTMKRALSLGVAYPYDWGFVPSTRAEDGDPLDALVLHDAGTFPGVVLACRALGMIELIEDDDNGERQANHRVIAVPTHIDRLDGTRTMSDLSPRARDELDRFFLNATFFTSKNAQILGWKGADETRQYVERCQTRR